MKNIPKLTIITLRFMAGLFRIIAFIGMIYLLSLSIAPAKAQQVYHKVLKSKSDELVFNSMINKPYMIVFDPVNENIPGQIFFAECDNYIVMSIGQGDESFYYEPFSCGTLGEVQHIAVTSKYTYLVYKEQVNVFSNSTHKAVYYDNTNITGNSVYRNNGELLFDFKDKYVLSYENYSNITKDYYIENNNKQDFIDTKIFGSMSVKY